MYVAGREHPNREPARRFLGRVRSGEVDACTSTEVLQEILYRYSSLKRLDLAGEVYDLFVQLCQVVYPVTLADTDGAKALLGQHAGVTVREALHAAVMRNHDVHTIATFDVGFDAFPGVKRASLL
jgi:predicted nucleic acid-binding protein